ncbi:hypothetical protein KDL01_11005 [Actinospica durhamensis]|uniref:DUF7144 domain-containing protein n=1 Tax=Actinospica durhamensis TaxID=1508375 RepID=A0A941ENQ1_9ACTN|nr:hypothetical protein [Actinospica durhamensis]MBR7833797.1 hypothetical protein [Actinospica durhamensis]
MAGHGTRWGAAKAGTALAAVLMILEGVLGIAQGVAAIAKDRVYALVGTYVYKFSLTTWGWIHLIAGVLVLLAGLALFTGSVVARALGIALSALVVFASLLALPYQPGWSAVTIAFGVFAIWALFHNVGPDAI